METSKLIHATMGEQVLKRLGKLVDIEQLISKGGVLAGQSVASAVAEIVQSPHATVFNDVDVFREIEKSEELSKRRRILDPLVQTDAYLKNAYGQLIACEDFHYKVQRTRREGLLNEVLCVGQLFRSSSGERAALSILESFDLNCVQVGVDLKTRNLVWTPAYERFLQTQELLVENIRTPVHTAIRWFRKKAELEGVFGNDERTMQMLAIVSQLLRPGESSSAQNQGQLNFSTPYLEKLEDVRKELSTWFNVEDSVSAWNLPKKSITSYIYGDPVGPKPRLQKQGDIPLYTLRPRFDPPTDWVPSHLSYRFSVPIIRAKQGFWKKHICEQILDAAAREESVQRLHLQVHGGKAFEKPHSPRALASLSKTLNNHQLNELFHSISLDKALVVNEALKALVAERGVLVYGVIETMYQGELSRKLPNDLNAAKAALAEVVDTKLAEMRKMKSIAPVVPEMELPGGYKLVELTKAEELLEEGSVMRHCVGGYYGKVSSGSARVLSLRPALRKNGLTMECNPKGFVFSTCQIHGILNRRADQKEADVGRMAMNALVVCNLLRWLPVEWRKRVAYYSVEHPGGVAALAKLNAFVQKHAPSKVGLSMKYKKLRLYAFGKLDLLATTGLAPATSYYDLVKCSLWQLTKYWCHLTKLRFYDAADRPEVPATPVHKKSPAGKVRSTAGEEIDPFSDDIPF